MYALLRIVQNLICQALFDDFSVQHHDGTVCQHPYHSEVMGYQQDGDMKLPPDFTYEF